MNPNKLGLQGQGFLIGLPNVMRSARLPLPAARIVVRKCLTRCWVKDAWSYKWGLGGLGFKGYKVIRLVSKVTIVISYV